mgnify:CR=1 FL=1
MKKEKSLTVNFIMNIILSMSAFIFPLITFPYVSRVLLPIGTGKVSFANSIIAYFALFAQLGIPTYGIRACAIVRDDKEKLTKTVQELLIINTIISVLVYIVFIIALFTVPKMRSDSTLFLITSTTIFFNVIGVEWLYKALEQYSYITIRSIIFKFIGLILMFILVKNSSDYVWYGFITIFAASASNIFNFINLHKYVSLKPVGNYNFKVHLKAVTIFFAMSCATTIYTNLDSVMIGFIKGATENGYYNAAVRIKSILVSIVTSLGAVLLPRASYYLENNYIDEFKKISKKAINFVILISIPMMIYFIMFAKESILFLAGDSYAKSIAPMQIIMPTLLFIGLTNIMGIQMLVPLGKEKYVLYSEIAGALIDLVLNALLIPHYGAAGAAVGTLVAEVVVWIVQFKYLKNDIIPIFKTIRYPLILLAAVISAAVAGLTKILDWHPFFILVVSAILYFGIYFLVLIIGKESLILELKDRFFGKVIEKWKKRNNG